MIYLSAEWRARKTARWLRYVRRFKVPHDGETNRRCWCTGCKPFDNGRNPFRTEYLKQLKRAKMARRLKK